MAEEVDPPPAYDPDLIAAIRQARADLYAAQAARRRVYLQTGRWVPQLDPDLQVGPRAEGDPPPAMTVDLCRANLDAARALAADSVPPPPAQTQGGNDADL